jgi:hypothetical protein
MFLGLQPEHGFIPSLMSALRPPDAMLLMGTQRKSTNLHILPEERCWLFRY